MRVAIQTSIDEWDCYIPENPVKSLVKLPENPARERRLEAGEYEKLMEACKRSSKFSSPFNPSNPHQLSTSLNLQSNYSKICFAATRYPSLL